MPLSSDFFNPFDGVYRDVTRLMNDRANQLTNNTERDWLRRIITAFREERDRWPDSNALVSYRTQWARLRFRLVRLIAAVYLHVSYDLPRVLADNWPSRGAWIAGPLEARAEWLYFDLQSIFSDVLLRRARRLATTGIFSSVLWLVPLKVIGNLVHWVSHLREAAWRHGRTLSALNQQQRTDTEQRMAEAMSLALRDVNNLPWTFVLPRPPNFLVRSIAIVPSVLIGLDAFEDMTFAFFGFAILIIGCISWILQKAEKISRFADEFAERVHRYMDLAINDPETFNTVKGRSDLGLSA